jgi:hypothetical protein
VGNIAHKLFMKKDVGTYYFDKPVEFIREFLGADPWEKQRDIANALVEHDRVTVRSGHGVGKSFIAACIIIWFLITHKDAKIVTTAPTFAQVKDILWIEIAKLHKELKKRIPAPYPRLTQVRLRIREGWEAWGRSTDDPNAFIGTHEMNQLLVFDEACGISRAIFQAAEGLLTAKGNKALLIGNPTDPGTFFHETHTGKVPGYFPIRISVFDSPNIEYVNGIWRDKDPLPYPKLTSLGWINEMRDKYGEKAPAWVSKVLGEFPDLATDALISGRWLAASVMKGKVLRETIERVEEGKEVLSAEEIALLTGRS